MFKYTVTHSPAGGNIGQPLKCCLWRVCANTGKAYSKVLGDKGSTALCVQHNHTQARIKPKENCTLEEDRRSRSTGGDASGRQDWQGVVFLNPFLFSNFFFSTTGTVGLKWKATQT